MSIINQINPVKFLDRNYIFEVAPAPSGYYIYLSVIFGLLLVLAIYLSLNQGKIGYRKLRRKFINLFLTVGIIGLTLIFFRFEEIAYLGSRLMLIILLLVFTAWLGFILWYRYLILPKELKEKLEKEKFEKYLPRRQAGLPRHSRGQAFKS